MYYLDIKYFIDKFEKMKGGCGGWWWCRRAVIWPWLRTVANNQSIYKTH